MNMAMFFVSFFSIPRVSLKVFSDLERPCSMCLFYYLQIFNRKKINRFVLVV